MEKRDMMNPIRAAEILSWNRVCVRCYTKSAGKTGRGMNMEEKKSGSLKNGKHLKGVVCDVKNCSFHDGDSCCTANRIAVGPSFASTSGETVCATFKPKML